MFNTAEFNYALFWLGYLLGIAGTAGDNLVLSVGGGMAVGWSTYRLYHMARYPEGY